MWLTRNVGVAEATSGDGEEQHVSASHMAISNMFTFDKYIGFLIVESGPSGPGRAQRRSESLTLVSKQSRSHGVTRNGMVD